MVVVPQEWFNDQWKLLGYDQPFAFYMEVYVFSFQVFQDGGKV